MFLAFTGAGLFAQVMPLADELWATLHQLLAGCAALPNFVSIMAACAF
jgi:hypothetical protein